MKAFDTDLNELVDMTIQGITISNIPRRELLWDAYGLTILLVHLHHRGIKEYDFRNWDEDFKKWQEEK